MTPDTHRDSIAEILERIAKEGLDGPRDLDVALDAILAEESTYINRQQARIKELEGREQTLKCVLAGERILHEDLEDRLEKLEALAKALIDDVRARYPGEELRCPHMIALDEALKGTDDDG